jgi:hypothetical protein
MSTARKPNPYANAKPFTNVELLEIIKKTPQGWLQFDIKNESKSEAMKENKVRYLNIIVTDLEGKVRPLTRTTVATTTKSQCKLGKADFGIPGAAKFSTRVLTDDEAKLSELADTIVQDKFPTLGDDEFTAMATTQEKLLKKEFDQWTVEKAIAKEFERMLNTAAERKKIGYVFDKTHEIAGNVQYERKPKEDDDAEITLADTTGGRIALEQPMCYKRIRMDKKDGSLWCKIYDVTGGAKTRKLASMKDPETGKVALLNHKTLPVWLRANSVFYGTSKYAMCITSKGCRLHENMTDMNVRRAAKTESETPANEEESAAMEQFGGSFAADDDDEEDDASAPVAVAVKAANPKLANLSNIERQLAEANAEAYDD